ncbi:low affinity immunoglobulin epsilon Fc receptor-like [Biomphalaria glabrata]|uniref:Low affinity immunoglobulin epsilon Fc receptor-like n=1 Tax=Biomphalaria glabrata TaxID=6526 RepID=A0A9U8E571_BIOGL|nr:low affinity immunoglobulin epsilon Fc receptor-like [Biomphalaria glabrata]
MSEIEDQTDNHDRTLKLLISGSRTVEKEIKTLNLTLRDNFKKLSYETKNFKIDFTNYVKTSEIDNLKKVYKQAHNDILSMNQTLKNTTDSLKIKYEKEFDNYKKIFENAKKEIDDTLRYKTSTIQSQVDNLVQMNKELTNENKKLKQLYNQLEGEIRYAQNIRKALRSSANNLFHVSSSHYERRYYLYKSKEINNFRIAQIVCHVFGGYLAEMDDWSEFKFVKTFLSSHDSCASKTSIMIGGTDEDQEGRWVHMSSGTPVVQLFWGTSEPGGGREENCLAIKECRDLHDYPCYPKKYYVKTFLCEVPNT